MKEQITIYDISKKAGVSIATVSRVLNGNDNVSAKTRKKVMDIIEDCGYKPNAFARGLGLNSMKTIGILCADSSDLYLAKAVYFIERDLRASGYNSILCCTGYEQEDRISSIKLLLSQHVDSIIMIGSQYVSDNTEDNDYIREAANSIPVMLLNGDLDGRNIYCTLCDDSKAITNVAEYLINTGCKNILYLYNSSTFSSQRKLMGFRNALLLHDMELKKEYIQEFPGGHDDIEGVKAFIQKLDHDGLSFDAVLTSEDFLAVGAMKYAQSNKLAVPQKLQIVGYNDSILAHCTEPAFTSVNNRLEDMCSQLVKTLIGTLGGLDMPAKTIFSGEIVFRDSTK